MAFGRFPFYRLFKAHYIDIVGGQYLLSLGVLAKSILTIINKLIKWTETWPI